MTTRTGSAAKIPGRHIPAMIWGLMAAGLVSGALVVAALSGALQRFDRDSAANRALTDQLHLAATQAEKTVRMQHAELLESLHGDGVTTPRERGSADDLERTLRDFELLPHVEWAAVAILARIDNGWQVHEKIVDWALERWQTKNLRSAALDATLAEISHMERHVSRLVGSVDVGYAQRLRSGGRATVALAENDRQLLVQSRRELHAAQLAESLRETSVLVRLLYFLEDPDAYPDLLWNRIQPAVDEAEYLIGQLNADGAEAGPLVEGVLRCRLALFGSKGVVDVRNQILSGGHGGLVVLQHRWCELKGRSQELREIVRTWHDAVHEELGELESAQASGSIQMAFALRTELQDVLKVLTLGGLGLSAVFVLLAIRFSRAARSQVDALDQARRDANAAAVSKSRFLANMSHEIRTPMNGVLGMAEMLEETVLSIEQQQMAHTIKTSADALLAILNDILDFSKIDAGKLQLEQESFSVRDTIDECMDLLTSSAEAKGIEIVSYVDPRVSTRLMGDAARLRQVFINLVGNGVKFTSEGHVAVLVDLVGESETGQTLEFKVEDTGVGIAPDVQKKLFSAFTQADASTTRRYGGTGLGLAICRRLVELMGGGRIGVDSEPGQGARFWFRMELPVAEDVPETPPANLSNLSLLVVDDNEVNRQLLVLQLANTRIGLDIAENGPQALEILRLAARRGRPFSMALLDMAMPGMDGVELARAIADDPEIPETRVSLLSSLGGKPDDVYLESAGITRWLSKPVRASRLLELLNEMAGFSSLNAEGSVVSADRQGSLHGIEVLVGEDNLINQQVLEHQLQSLGCSTKFVQDGTQVLAALQEKSFDVVLMDCQMPGMDGFEAARAIHSLPEPISAIPIIALTANVLPSDRDACYAAGMVDFLTKPVKRDVLRATLTRWVNAAAQEV